MHWSSLYVGHKAFVSAFSKAYMLCRVWQPFTLRVEISGWDVRSETGGEVGAEGLGARDPSRGVRQRARWRVRVTSSTSHPATRGGDGAGDGAGERKEGGEGGALGTHGGRPRATMRRAYRYVCNTKINEREIMI